MFRSPFAAPFQNAMGQTPPLFLPQNMLNVQHVVLEDFESGWSATSGCTIADDPVHVVSGAKSLEIAQSAPGVAAIVDKTVNFSASPYDTFRLAIYCGAAQYAKFASLRLYLSNDAGFGKYFNIATAVYLQRQWTMIDFPKASFTNVGGASWSNNIVKIRLRITGQAGQVTTISVDRLAGGPQHNYPAVRIEFDDGYASVYTAGYPAMKSKSLRGTVYVITNLIDSAGYLTAGQLQELYANGWSIANHTSDHTNLTTLSQADQQTKLSTAKAALDALGFTRCSDMVAYPYNAYDDNTLAAMATLAYKTGRAADSNNSELLIPANNFVLGNYGVANTVTLAVAKAKVDAAVSGKCIWALLFHKLVASPSVDIEWAISDFEQLIDYIVAQKSLALTIGDFYNLQTGSINIPRTW